MFISPRQFGPTSARSPAASISRACNAAPSSPVSANSPTMDTAPPAPIALSSATTSMVRSRDTAIRVASGGSGRSARVGTHGMPASSSYFGCTTQMSPAKPDFRVALIQSSTALPPTKAMWRGFRSRFRFSRRALEAVSFIP